MAAYFKDSAWENAYDQRNLPDAISAYAEAASAAFDARLVAITTKSSRFGSFNGINSGDINDDPFTRNAGYPNLARKKRNAKIGVAASRA